MAANTGRKYQPRYQLFFHVFTKPLCGCSALVRSIYQTAVKTNGRQNGVFLQACLLGQHQWHISHVLHVHSVL